ncbi:unnamed protein product [Ambrosiozyma monospora]|uniref:Unnamed protein product n=1 Tax=Ambrosiozyma monospora TaxID=43982 RepID=A0A9W6YXR3_AMBMO|nr:unnamed protein product [Ambrosiozyma monospora]
MSRIFRRTFISTSVKLNTPDERILLLQSLLKYSPKGNHTQDKQHPVEIPAKLPNAEGAESLLQRESYPFPFFAFSYTDALKVSLHRNYFAKYLNYISVKSKRTRTDFKKNQTLVDLMLANHLNPASLSKLKVFDHKEIDDVFTMFLKDITLSESQLKQFDGEVSSFITEITFSKRNDPYAALIGLLKQCMVDPEFEKLHLAQIYKEIAESMTRWDYNKIISLISQLIKYDQYNFLKEIIEIFEKHHGRPIMEILPPVLKLKLFEFFTIQGHFQLAKDALISAVNVDRFAPSVEMVRQYLCLIDQVARKFDTTEENKRIIFNGCAISVTPLLLAYKPLAALAEIFKISLSWISSFDELLLFLNFIPESKRDLVSPIDIISQFGKFDNNKLNSAINLTSLIARFGTDYKFDDSTNKLIAQLYIKFESPIAAAHYLKKTTLTNEEQKKLSKLVSGFGKESPIPGVEQAHIDNLAKLLL